MYAFVCMCIRLLAYFLFLKLYPFIHYFSSQIKVNEHIRYLLQSVFQNFSESENSL